MPSKDLFIPLITKHYNAFDDGSKVIEYRIHGPRWNVGTVWNDRPVTISKGYGKQNRLKGKVLYPQILSASELPLNVQQDIKEIYGEGDHEMICIHILLEKHNEY